jgi:hypothetical protein
VIAPTNGATVSVRSLDVLGTVSPRDAVVLVSGRRARVAGGEFKLPLTLTGAVTHITVVATARGYVTSTTPRTVHYAAAPQSQQPGGPASALARGDGPSLSAASAAVSQRRHGNGTSVTETSRHRVRLGSRRRLTPVRGGRS